MNLAKSIRQNGLYCHILDPILSDIIHLKLMIIPAYVESRSDNYYFLGQEGRVKTNITKEYNLL